jgi:hypothetical protein
MPPIAPTWNFAKAMYESLRNTRHEPTARAYLEATGLSCSAWRSYGRSDAHELHLNLVCIYRASRGHWGGWERAP